MTWPAPTTRWPKGVKLKGGPDDGKVWKIRGTYMIATPAIFPNGYIGVVGRYEYRRDARTGEVFGEFVPASV